MNGDGPVRRLFRLGIGGPDPSEAVEWEIEHHLEESAERLVREGWDAVEARREAERRFGRERYGPRLRRMERRREAMRTTTRWWEAFRDGAIRTSRGARRHPGFAAAVVATLGLGIGANAAMFGIIDRLLLRPPAHVDDPDRVRRVILHRDDWIGPTLTFPDYVDLGAHDGFETVAAFTNPREYTVGSGPDATRAKVVLASHGLFDLLGAEPALGRAFTADEDRPGAPGTAVVGHEYWRRALGGTRDVLGRTLALGGDAYTVVGVAPPGFTGVDLSRVDVWLPIEAAQYIATGDTGWKDGQWARGNWWMMAVARLADGETVEAAESQATALHRNARREMIEQGRYYEEPRIELRHLIAARGEGASAESSVARWLGGVSLVVLLIACANVANLLLARSVRRRREVAVRLALGVSRGRLVARVMGEATLLALAGGAFALVLARWGGAVVRRTLLPDVHFPHAAVDGRVVAFTVGVSLLAGLLAGVGPALQSTRADVAGELSEGGRGATGGRSRTRSALVVAQATLSLLLLVGAGLFVRSLGRVRSLDLGLDPDRVILARLEMKGAPSGVGHEPPSWEAVDRTYRAAVERVRAMPGVEAAAATSAPFQYGFAQALDVPGVDSIPRLPGGGPYYYGVTPGYFRALGLEVLLGRPVLESDGPTDAKVAVVSRTMAESLWPGASPLGRCLWVGDEPEGCTEVVGMVEDASRGSLQTEPYMAYYLPASQAEAGLRGMYVRAGGDARELVGPVADALRTFSPDVRYATARTLRDMLDPQARSWALGATMFSVFGLLALVVAGVGLYGVLAFEVARRTRELGIRSALGAARRTLLGAVVGRGLRLVAAGVFAGLLAAWFLAPLLEGLLFEVSPRDPVVLATVAGVLAATALVAGLLPGLRATRVDPARALRSE